MPKVGSFPCRVCSGTCGFHTPGCANAALKFGGPGQVCAGHTCVDVPASRFDVTPELLALLEEATSQAKAAREKIDYQKERELLDAELAERAKTDFVPGYHLREIAKGELGEISKIREELEELEDAHQQGVRILALVELSDLYGAIRRYVDRHHPGTTMKDIADMHEVTKRAFENGRR